MTFIEKIQLIERLDALIKRRGTGSPKKLAYKLEIAESTLYENIKIMKEMGAPIIYDRSRQSYCYENSCEFKIGFYGNLNDLRGGVDSSLFGKIQHHWSGYISARATSRGLLHPL